MESVSLGRDYEKITGIYILPGTDTALWSMIKVKDRPDSPARIQAYRSDDGRDWMEEEGCAIERGPEGTWSARGLGTASLRARGAGVDVWYRADDPANVQAIGYLHSDDRCTFTPPNEPVVEPVETWSSYAVVGPHVLEAPDGDLWMYYRGSPWENQSDSPLGLATSADDGQTWTFWPDNPVMDMQPGSWSSSLLGDPHVWREGDVWLMLYSGHNRPNTPEQSANTVGLGKVVGIAASADGLHWEECYAQPVLTEGRKVDNPFVWREGDRTVVYVRVTDETDGSGGIIERVVWEDWPRWD